MKYRWIRFLRKYGPIARNDNMYDETILRSSRRMKIDPILFEHPYAEDVLNCFDSKMTTEPVSVILTGTAGDGKTHLCRQVWKSLKGGDDEWLSDNPYLKVSVDALEHYRTVTVHFIRDLSGWAPQKNQKWEPEKAKLLQKFCKSLFEPDASDIFLIAGNDGQLIETFKRFEESSYVEKTRQALEDLLFEGKRHQKDVRLNFFNLSQGSSTELFRRAIDKFLTHSGWEECMSSVTDEDSAFGQKCPIRLNYELLKTELVQSRLAALFDLCGHMGLHIPIRQILLLLTNAVLGHPDVTDHLMVPEDVPKLIKKGITSEASLYNNVFGGNLTEARRQGITVFDYLDRFQIGYETSNRIDNILLYGHTDPDFKDYYKDLIESNPFYEVNKSFSAAKIEYIEGVDESDSSTKKFLQLLINQRRAFFFRIPQAKETELRLWELTVFRFAGEYISEVSDVVKTGNRVKGIILARLSNGLNRIFTGMLINDDRDILLATSGNYSQAKISSILVDRVSLRSKTYERVTIEFDQARDCIIFKVQLEEDLIESLDLNLVRYEFLSRIAVDGALPASFSKECYEDILAFKSKLIAALKKRKKDVNNDDLEMQNILRVLSLSEQGKAEDIEVEVIP